MSLALTFIGNATVLLRCGPFTLLTDPNFLHAGQRAYLGHGLFSKRLLEPALDVTALPQLDVVVLSHLHGDHWDRVTRRHLDRSLPIVTTPQAARRLQGLHGFRQAAGLETWETQTHVKEGWRLTVTSLPARHAPGAFERLLPRVMGSLLELTDKAGQRVHRVYLTGDTLMHEAINEIADRYSDIDLAVVHLGGTRLPGGLLVTMDGLQGADLIQAVGPRVAVPVHTDDYTVFTSPLEDFTREIASRGLTDRVMVVGRGETVQLD